MFNAVLSSGKLWKQIIDAISTLINEARFVAEPEALFLRALDPSKAAMVDLYIPNASFDEYHCDERYEISVSMDDLVKVTKRVQGDDLVQLSLQPERERLQITLVGRAKRVFSLPLLDSTEPIPKKPNLKSTTKIEMNGELLKQAIRDAQVVASQVIFEASEKAFEIKGTGDAGEVSVIVERENEAVLSMEISAPSRAMYALSYLSDMIKAISASDTVRLQFASERPLQMDFGLPGGGRISYIIAPRVERV